jgi:hypothetical protein
MANRLGDLKLRQKFTPDEDALLRSIVEEDKAKDWTEVAALLPGRNARQCRDRWSNYVNPKIESAPWTQEEEELLEAKFRQYGSKWYQIGAFFPNRSKAQLKCQWRAKHKDMRKRHPDEPGPAKNHLPARDVSASTTELFSFEMEDETSWRDFLIR